MKDYLHRNLRWAGAAIALAVGFSLCPTESSAQGLTWSVVPSARWIDWDDDLGLDRSRLLGGSLDIGFGRYVGLSAFYHQGDDLQFTTPIPGTDFSSDVSQAGGAITLAFGTGTLVPVVKGGASIIRFRPDGVAVEDFSKLSFDYGGGLRAILGETVFGEVMVENSEFRLANGRLRGDPITGNREPTQNNLSLRAGLGIQLGSRTFDRASEMDDAFAQTYDSPFDNFALAIEPGFARFTFDDVLGIEDQDAWGGRAGFDFGSFFGLRGFYWRGTEDDDLGDFSEFQAYGGEAQFNLGAGPGINPYLLAGVTRFDWDSPDSSAIALDGRNAVTLGAGLDIDVSDRLRLSFSARDNILASADVGGNLLQGASDPDDLIHNWQFSAGLGIVLGEGRSERETRTRIDDAPARPEPASAEVRNAAAAEPATPRVAVDSTVRTMRSDTIEIQMPAERDPRSIVLPVLESGEIYIRFGASGGSPFTALGADSIGAAPSETELRRIIREEIEAIQASGTANSALIDEVRALEQRLQERLDQMESSATRPGGQTPPQVVVGTETEEDTGVSRASRELRPYTGISLSGGTQLLLGVMSDLGPLNENSAFSIVPQIAVGVGDGRPSYLFNASLEYRFNEVGASDAFRLTPIVSAGPSIVSQGGTDFRLSTFLGTGVHLMGDEDSEGLNLFTGYQGIDLFDAGRWIIGLRFTR